MLSIHTEKLLHFFYVAIVLIPFSFGAVLRQLFGQSISIIHHALLNLFFHNVLKLSNS